MVFSGLYVVCVNENYDDINKDELMAPVVSIHTTARPPLSQNTFLLNIPQ